jgi:hypothetical protein
VGFELVIGERRAIREDMVLAFVRPAHARLGRWTVTRTGPPPEYGDLAESCKLLIWDTALQVLPSGTDVVLDWNQWSRERRAVWRDKARAAGFPAILHHVRTPLDAAVERVSNRATDGDPWSHRLDEAGVRHLARIFEPPGPDEGLDIRPVSGR